MRIKKLQLSSRALALAYGTVNTGDIRSRQYFSRRFGVCINLVDRQLAPDFYEVKGDHLVQALAHQ